MKYPDVCIFNPPLVVVGYRHPGSTGYRWLDLYIQAFGEDPRYAMADQETSDQRLVKSV